MSFSPFLTAVDSRAQVKGSRDPLGMQPIWVRIGRQYIGNLTTVSSSVRGFTTLLLGLYFAERVVEQDRSASTLEVFLRWEQLVAYARGAVAEDFDFRGTERVKARLSKGREVTLSAEPSHQILGDQKIYGLWGLFTVAARTSGLVTGEPPRLTDVARRFVESEYLPALASATGKDAGKLVELLALRRASMDLGGRERPLAQATGALHRPKLSQKERDFYRTHLAHGGPDDETGGRQRQLAELVERTLEPWSPPQLLELAKKARKHGAAWMDLADRLERTATYESVLAPASDLFVHLLGCHDRTVDEVVSRVRSAWGPRVGTVSPEAFGALRGDLLADGPLVEGWISIAEALSAGAYERLLGLLLEQNRLVTNTRGGAPWVAQAGGKLTVRFQSETGALPSKDGLAKLWRNPYFLDSLRSVVRTIDGGRA